MRIIGNNAGNELSRSFPARMTPIIMLIALIIPLAIVFADETSNSSADTPADALPGALLTNYIESGNSTMEANETSINETITAENDNHAGNAVEKEDMQKE